MDERAAAIDWSAFWSRVDRKQPNQCWIWKGFVNDGGYGQFSVRVNGKVRVIQAHRVVWEWLIGPIPSRRTIDHLCQNTRCVNPSHLNVVTQAENSRRAALLRTTDTPSPGLGTALRTARLRRGLTATDVARLIGVTTHTVINWEHGQLPQRRHEGAIEAFLNSKVAA